MSDIHTRIKRLREARQMSLEALAKEVGVSWQAAQQWEKPDGTAPKRLRLSRVAEVLKTTTGYLLNGHPDKHEGNVRHLAQPVAEYHIPNDPDILAVVSMMKSTDDRGRSMALAAVKVALANYVPAAKNHAQ